MDLQFCTLCGAVTGFSTGAGRVSRYDTHEEWHKEQDIELAGLQAQIDDLQGRVAEHAAKPHARRKSGE